MRIDGAKAIADVTQGRYYDGKPKTFARFGDISTFSGHGHDAEQPGLTPWKGRRAVTSAHERALLRGDRPATRQGRRPRRGIRAARTDTTIGRMEPRSTLAAGGCRAVRAVAGRKADLVEMIPLGRSRAQALVEATSASTPGHRRARYTRTASSRSGRSSTTKPRFFVRRRSRSHQWCL